MGKIFQHVAQQEAKGGDKPPNRSCWLPPVNCMNAMRKAFTFAGAKVRPPRRVGPRC